MKKLIPILALVAFLWSCDNSNKNTEASGDETLVENNATAEHDHDHDHEEEASQESFPDPDAVGNFGAPVSAEGAAIAVAQLPSQLKGQDSMRVKVQGTVKAVCQAKGCWMTIPIKGDDELMVKFKDYAFFMPKNASGKTATMEGWAYKEVVSVDELRHYAEDEGLAKEEIEKITEPKERLTFMADGVVIEE